MIWLCSWQGYILVTSTSSLSGNGDRLSQNLFVCVISLCMSKPRKNRELFNPRSAEENAVKLFYLTKRSKTGVEDLIRYIRTSLHTTCNFCFCYLEKGLVSVCSGYALVNLHSGPEQASAIATFFLHSTPAVPRFVRVQRCLWKSSAVNHSSKLLCLKANLAEGFFVLFVLLPYFSARSLNHSSLHRYTNSSLGLTTEVVQGWVPCKHQRKHFSLQCIPGSLKY